MTRHLLLPAVAAGLALLLTAPLAAAPGDQPVPPLPPTARGDDPARVRSATLPARGLFVGDQLSAAARERLAELLVAAGDLHVEVALLVPSGPWQIDGSGAGERHLTPARLDAVRRFLAQRGIDPKRIFVESRVDARLSEPQLTVQMVGRPATE